MLGVIANSIVILLHAFKEERVLSHTGTCVVTRKRLPMNTFTAGQVTSTTSPQTTDTTNSASTVRQSTHTSECAIKVCLGDYILKRC